jgi:hypothetical protein
MEIANNAIYFDDNSDYRSALWDICSKLGMADDDIGAKFIEANPKLGGANLRHHKGPTESEIIHGGVPAFSPRLENVMTKVYEYPPADCVKCDGCRTASAENRWVCWVCNWDRTSPHCLVGLAYSSFSEVRDSERRIKVKRLVLPYFCPISPNTDVDKLAHSIAIYLGEEGVEDLAALPVAIAVLAAVQEFALHGADAAHTCLQQHLPRSKRQNADDS